MKRADTTSNRSGYPERLIEAIIGFENWNQIEQISKALNIEPEVFNKKEGWNIWVRNYARNVRPFNLEQHYLNRECNEGSIIVLYNTEDTQSIYRERVLPLLENAMSMEESEKIINEWKEIFEEIQTLGDDEILVHENGYRRTINKEDISYTEDTDMYEIGFVSSDKRILEKIENFEFKEE